MHEFKDKVAFITGGASGVGFGQAQIFSEAGCKVVIADIRGDHLEEALSHFKNTGAQVHGIKLDVTDREAFENAALETTRVFGAPPELLLLTAGVNAFGPAEAATYEDFDWVVGVCLGGAINGLVTFVPRMVKAGNGGHIGVTSSFGALSVAPIIAPYAAAKGGVNAMMESYLLSLEPYGIGVSVLCPANVNSNIFESGKTRPEKLRNTGFNMTGETEAFLKSVHATGIEPRELARIFKEAIENDVFLVVPYANPDAIVHDVLARMADYTTPEGMKRVPETIRLFNEKHRAAIEGETGEDPYQNAYPGFGKAREGVGWVADEKKL
ncbi:MAG: SDR family NAD(P)-dependent oxidoreductase [Clostridiales Family XIII bacterium]|nr:SDR family NAD(P)-dependent oxidoreductase [Clostridiales Family XIII bacterium]